MKQLFIILVTLLTFSCTMQDSPSNITLVTLSGSYATMLPIDGFLYVIDDSKITTYDISDNQNPVRINKQEVGFLIESLYHHEGVLFIGSSEALHIFTINENGIPERNSLTEYNFENDPEWTACDPVVADDSYAYVTLKTDPEFSFDPCGVGFRTVNELRIYDVQDLSTPELLSVTEMQYPQGLGIFGDHLFVCEGNQGIQLYDVTDREEPVLVWEDLGFKAFDLILKEDLMIVVGSVSLRQYDISDLENIEYINEIIL